MDRNKNFIKQKLSGYICPALLGAVICFAVIYALYRPRAYVYSVIFLISELLLFTFFDKLKTKKVVGGLVYFLIMLVVLLAAFRLAVSGYRSGEGDVISWFYGEDGNYSRSPYYLNAVFLAGGFFVLSILYYFTQVRYRSLGAMLSILFPFVIYAKRAEDIPEVLVTLIITLYIAVMVHNRRIDPAVKPETRGRLVVNRSYLISMAVFVSVTGALTMLIDKPDHQSKLEQNSNYFNYVQTNATGSGDYESMQQSSSRRYGNAGYTNEVIFNFETDGSNDTYFLRRQSFDDFDGNVWQLSDDSNNYARVFSSDNPEIMYDDILKAMRAISENGGDLNGALPSEELAPRVNGRAYDDDFSPYYLPAPFGVITDELTLREINASSNKKYSHGEVMRNLKKYGDSEPIDESYEFLEQSAELYDYAARLSMSGEEYERLLEDAVQSGIADENILADYRAAKEKYSESSYVSDRITRLAQEITADCESDLEKARALEKYFEQNGYVYDLEYVPPDESIEYFIFEGKTGVCSNYATAMTLMARAVGLPARYVEGFAAFERDENGSFVIRDSYAHAFVEVYIPGAGWLTFDPTVPDYKQIPEQSNFDAASFITVLARLLVVIAVAFVIIFILLLDRIVERFFRIRLHFKKPREQTLALYSNLIKLVNFSAQGDYSSYTVDMLRGYLAETRGAVPEKLLRLFEKTCFGGYEPSAEEFSDAYGEYKKTYKYMRKIPKKK